jgi:hypothetical protein
VKSFSESRSANTLTTYGLIVPILTALTVTIVPSTSPLTSAILPASLSSSASRDWSASGHLPPMQNHWLCLPATVVAGIVPAIAIVVMLRHGAPMAPRLTTAFAALAVAGIANVGIRFVHPFDLIFVVLAWHVVAVFALSATAASFGDRVFSWRKALAASGVEHF